MTRNFLLITGLCALLSLAACNKQSARADDDEDNPATAAGAAPSASASTLEKPTWGQPGPAETLYITDVQNSQGLPITRAEVRILTEQPEGLDLFQPRRKTVQHTYRTPPHGQVGQKVTADGQPKILWIGGEGFHPHTQTLPAATGGAVHRQTVQIEILPIWNMAFVDHQGNRVVNGIVTVRPPDFGSGKYAGRMADVYRRARRTDDAGKLSITRRPGTYQLIASKENGTSRRVVTIDWDGSAEEQTFTLPEKSDPTPGR